MHARLLRTTAVALAAAAVLAQAAFAWGEPKNEWPFTRPVGARAPQEAAHHAAQVDTPIRGEPKNEPPFMRTMTVVVSRRLHRQHKRS
jgi:hypothetical protein